MLLLNWNWMDYQLKKEHYPASEEEEKSISESQTYSGKRCITFSSFVGVFFDSK